jgi:Holliday junction resolvasome RuvABC endonuclease subunit
MLWWKGRTMYLTIDPGLAGTGWAVWDISWKLKCWGVIYESRELTGAEWHLRALDIANRVEILAMQHKIKIAYIEQPAFFQSAGGQTTARSGALIKLTTLVGMIMSKLKTITPVAVNKWKGQLPKNIVIERIQALLPDVKAHTHAWDAIGLGLYLKGDLK